MKTMIIYKALNKANGKIYIGQTMQPLHDRIMRHLRRSYYFPNALKKYGIKAFDFSIIDSAGNRDELNEKEKHWIRFYNCKVPKGYNLTDGGDGSNGLSPSSETRKKLSELNKGKHHSEEARRKISEAGKGRIPAIFGKHHSKETRIKMSEARRKWSSSGMKGKHLSEEHRKKLSDKLRGRHVSEETREKMSINNQWHGPNRSEKGLQKLVEHNKANPPWKGRHHSEETKRKMSESKRRNDVLRFNLVG